MHFLTCFWRHQGQDRYLDTCKSHRCWPLAVPPWDAPWLLGGIEAGLKPSLIFFFYVLPFDAAPVPMSFASHGFPRCSLFTYLILGTAGPAPWAPRPEASALQLSLHSVVQPWLLAHSMEPGPQPEKGPCSSSVPS